MSDKIFKPVADVFALIHAGGEPYQWTQDAILAAEWLRDNPNYSVKEFVSLDRYQAAATDDLSALQQKLDAVLAENVALKSNLMYWDDQDPEAPYDSPKAIADDRSLDFGIEFEVQVAARMPNLTYRVSAVSEYSCEIELVDGSLPETPATDAILNEVRAEGVEMFAAEREELRKHYVAKKDREMAVSADHCAMAAFAFAEELRARKVGGATHD